MKLLDLTNFTGATPIKIYLADSLGGIKTYFAEIVEPTSLPVTIPPFNAMEPIMVIAEDDNGCETFQVISCTLPPTPTPTPTPPFFICECPSGYTVNGENDGCYRVETQSATSVSNLGVGYLTPNAAYGDFGFYVYNQNGYNLDGSVIGDYAYNGQYWGADSGLDDIQLFWGNRLNFVGVWVQGQPYWPNPNYPDMVSFCETINIASGKTYYFGIAADNDVKVRLNGNLIISQPENQPYQNFKYWHIYPIYIDAGPNIIEMEGWNRSIVGGFGAEIYDNTLEELTGATGTSMVNLVFSTGDYLDSRTIFGHTTGCTLCAIGTVPQGSKFGEAFCSNYSCPDGYELDTTDPNNYQCVRITRVDCVNSVSPTPTPTLTTTPTPTPSQP